MNSSGLMRGRMAKSFENEAFLLFVGVTIEKQLQEWDERYEVNMMKLVDYHFVVKNGETYYDTVITEAQVAALQDSGPYALDRVIWQGLEKDGLTILEGFGNYLKMVFWGKDN